MAKYEIRFSESPTTSLPVIIDVETQMNVLAIDTREVDGIAYSTPVFASHEIAQRILRLLNGESNG